MSLSDEADTIFALSSGSLPAAIAVVRISGAGAWAAVSALSTGAPPSPRRAALRALRDPADGTLLDRALVLLFRGPGTATGEDVVELHLHGGRAVVRAVSLVLGAIPGLRPAEPGEFTRRALLNGRVDLTQAEGLADLLSAESEAARRAAVAMSGGALRRQVERWQAVLLMLSARLEAELDFADEDDVPDAVLQTTHGEAAALAREMAAVIEGPTAERIRDGVRVVLSGPPNAGKSTLFNALAGRDAAIVSPIAGTTRDRIEAWVERAGIGYTLVDTAGLSERSDDPVEAIGVALARAAARDADIVLWLGDEPAHDLNALWLLPRCDARATAMYDGRLAVSARTGMGLPELWRRIEARAANFSIQVGALVPNMRQRTLVSAATGHVRSASAMGDPLLIAEELRLTRARLDELTGRAGTEEMLDALFGRFCIGK